METESNFNMNLEFWSVQSRENDKTCFTLSVRSLYITRRVFSSRFRFSTNILPLFVHNE